MRRHGRIEHEIRTREAIRSAAPGCCYSLWKHRPPLRCRIADAHVVVPVVGGIEQEAVAVVQDHPVLGPELVTDFWDRQWRGDQGRSGEEVGAAVVDVVDDDAADLVREKGTVREAPVPTTS